MTAGTVAPRCSGRRAADAPTGLPGTTIFAEMSALAAATGAINLGQGFPDTDGPAEVLRAAQDAIAGGPQPVPARPRHRDRCARRSPGTSSAGTGSTSIRSTEVLVTAGATEALAATLLAFVDDGDEVVTLEPAYDAYGAMIAPRGRRAPHRAAALARLPARRRPAPRRDHRPHPRDPR